MNNEIKMSAVILAGGQARRMNGQDKGLILYHDRPLVTYALEAVNNVCEDVMISANRNLSQYQSLGYRVVSDQYTGFNGPLAGIQSAMIAAKEPYLLVLPCDSPLIAKTDVLRLKNALINHLDRLDLVIAHDGQRPYPVFMAVKTQLKTHLADYLNQGQRKLMLWCQQQRMDTVDFSHQLQALENINTPDALKAMNRGNHSMPH